MADHRPDAIAVEFGEQHLSYRELVDRVQRTAQSLLDHGVGSGDRIAYLGGDGPIPIELLFACARIGAIYLPLNTRLVPAELSWIIEHAEPTLLLADADHASVLGQSVDGVPDATLAVIGPGAVEGFDHFEMSERASQRVADGTEPVLMCYTSGTTGRPKGALLDQAALEANAANIRAFMDLTSSDRVLNTMPMFHVGGLNVHTTPTLTAGGTIVLHPRFDAKRVLDEMTAGDLDLVTLLATMLVAVTNLPGFADADLSGLRAVNTGASAIPTPLIEAIHAKGIPVTQMYGLTETATLATCLRSEHSLSRIGSCGKAAAACEIRLVDDSGHDVDRGNPGEIVVRGSNVMREYWRDPDGTTDAFLDGDWFRTGDVAIADGDGFLYIQDRKKDLIISGGENVYPAELEGFLIGVPGVSEAAIIGRPDERWGEVPVIVAVAATAPIDAAELLARFEGQVARYKIPKRVIWVEALPRTAMGKVQKHLLRDSLRGGG